MRYSCLLGVNHKFIVNVTKKDHKVIKMHHFVACSINIFQHSNVATFEGSFECKTFVYALLVYHLYVYK